MFGWFKRATDEQKVVKAFNYAKVMYNPMLRVYEINTYLHNDERVIMSDFYLTLGRGETPELAWKYASHALSYNKTMFPLSRKMKGGQLDLQRLVEAS